MKNMEAKPLNTEELRRLRDSDAIPFDPGLIHWRLIATIDARNREIERGKIGKHTPGPLHAYDPGDYGDYGGDCVVVCDPDRRIAVFHGSGKEAKANAALFCAAAAIVRGRAK